MSLWMNQIVEQYGEEYIFRQLAEESSELCQASLKMVRSMRGETPVRMTEAYEHVLEEVADIEVMLHVLKTAVLNDGANAKVAAIFQKKKDRMIDRMLEGECLDSDGK
ncbi:MAG: hypothetical protein IKF99_11925 [Oscillospiraceae bacterium]|nr:hypothetical protein [Oscillospiraceae bacterium]